MDEFHASIDIQRTFRGFQGRKKSFRRRATLAFARATAERYANPERFAVANLRAFNDHGGFLGMAGIDARSLLASSVGIGDGEYSGAVEKASIRKSYVKPRGKRNKEQGGREECGESEGVVWLRLRRRREGDRGLSADVRVAGIAEVGIRACLRRCPPSSFSRAGIARRGAAEEGGVEIERTDQSITSVGFGHGDDIPPLTLKLELISVQDGWNAMARSCSSEEAGRKAEIAAVRDVGRDDDSSLAPTDDISEEGDSSSSSSSEKRRCHRGRGSDGDSIGTKSEDNTRTGSDESDTWGRSNSGGSNSDGSEWSRGSNTTATSSSSNGATVHKDEGSSERRTIHPDADVAAFGTTEHRQQEFQCNVAWCGDVVGGTRAPLTGLPTPRWEGEVFYLPLCAAGASSHDGKNAAETRESVFGGFRGDGSRIAQNFRGRKDGRENTKPMPPLLTITLNKLSSGAGGHTRCVRGEDGHTESPGLAARCRTPWSAFLSGFIDPLPIARAELEAGDALSMLGSQQVKQLKNNSIACISSYAITGSLCGTNDQTCTQY